MLGRYQMKRGAKAADLPAGIRQDTRRHTQHVLRPPAELVDEFLANPDGVAWDRFRAAYREAVRSRFADAGERFGELAELARNQDVYLGCSCPTRKNPDVRHCHTWLALELMAELYPDLEVVFPHP